MRRRKPAEDRKADIVAAVLDLADRIGPDRLTTNDVAQSVGVTQAAIFRHFPTKADMWAEVGTVIGDRLSSAWQRAVTENNAPEARLRALIAAQLTQIERAPALPAILHSRELNVDNDRLRQMVGGVLMQFQAHLMSNLEAMAANGTVSPALSPKDGAALLISLVQGIAIRWSLGSRGFPLLAEGMRLLDVQLSLFDRKETLP